MAERLLSPKELALQNLDRVLAIKPCGNDDMPQMMWEGQYHRAAEIARAYGATQFEILDHQFDLVPPETAQAIFDNERFGGFQGMTLDEAITLRDKYQLKG